MASSDPGVLQRRRHSGHRRTAEQIDRAGEPRAARPCPRQSPNHGGQRHASGSAAQRPPRAGTSALGPGVARSSTWSGCGGLRPMRRQGTPRRTAAAAPGCPRHRGRRTAHRPTTDTSMPVRLQTRADLLRPRTWNRGVGTDGGRRVVAVGRAAVGGGSVNVDLPNDDENGRPGRPPPVRAQCPAWRPGWATKAGPAGSGSRPAITWETRAPAGCRRGAGEVRAGSRRPRLFGGRVARIGIGSCPRSAKGPTTRPPTKPAAR